MLANGNITKLLSSTKDKHSTRNRSCLNCSLNKPESFPPFKINRTGNHQVEGQSTEAGTMVRDQLDNGSIDLNKQCQPVSASLDSTQQNKFLNGKLKMGVVNVETHDSSFQLSCLALNVCGILSKMLSRDFIETVTKYDIIAFSETKLDDFDSISIQGYTAFYKNRSIFKRKSGGIMLCIKNTLLDHITIIESVNRKDRIRSTVMNKYKFINSELSDNVLYFQLSPAFAGCDVLFGCVYLPPEGSDYFDGNAFLGIENDLLLLNHEAFCFMGDFNAKTALLADFDDNNYEEDDFITNGRNGVVLPHRKSDDTCTNRMGRNLIDFCKSANAFIVNGRFGCPYSSGRCTSKEASVVDYVVMSLTLADNVQDFAVRDFSELLSDIHCPISLSLNFHGKVLHDNSTCNFDNNIPCGKKIVERPKWYKDSSSKFFSKLMNAEREIATLNKELTDMINSDVIASQQQIEDVCSSIGNLMKSAASDIGLYDHKSKSIQHRKTEACPWFDKECERKRKDFFRAKNRLKFSKCKKTKEDIHEKSKVYKKQLRTSFHKYQSKFIKKLKSLKSKDPKVYWKIINGSTLEKQAESAKLSSEVFLAHFQGINDGVESSADVLSGTPDNAVHHYSHILEDLFSEEEVTNCIKNLRNNKACGSDGITNEFLKAASTQCLSLFTNFFNVILKSSKVPEDWTVAIIKPLFKQKGSIDDPNNYRGISLLSCFGKLFTSLINFRLNKFFYSCDTIGMEQAGFRAGHGVTDHIFTLSAIVDFFLYHKKRLYCVFIDYEKAFDLVNRSYLWQKLINAGVSGPILNVVTDIYSKAKSCVQWQSSLSSHFTCSLGVRQGENLSPLLFSIYLNDLKEFLNDRTSGLESIKKEAEKCLIDQKALEELFQLFILLYADDTVIFAESPSALQKYIDAMCDYCKKWKLKINTSKTKVMIFSRGKVRKCDDFTYDGRRLEIVYEFQYLGIRFNYNGKFKVAQKNLSDRASRAMFALLRKIRKLCLPVDVQIDLFDKTVVPILLYGSEIWCPELCDLIEKFQIRFFKIILKLNKSTPTNMVLGELGQFPLSIQAKCRMLNFWFKLAYQYQYGTNRYRLSSSVYMLLLRLYKNGEYSSSYLESIETTLNNLGLSFIWNDQQNAFYSAYWFKNEVKRRLQDQFIQKWHEEISDTESFYNYRMFKKHFEFEKYLSILPFNLAHALLKLRTLNHKLPIQNGRILGMQRRERICFKCNKGDIGDEFHYLFCCDYFSDSRKLLIKKYYYRSPNTIKYNQLLENESKQVLLKLVKFVKIILKAM